MAIRYDIALENNDIYFTNGDLLIAESDTQHSVETMNAFAGWWKEYPLDGVGILGYQKSPANAQEINRKIYLEVGGDGYKIKAPLVTLSAAGELFINPNAELL
jgi:hypothetical protein